MQGEESFPLEKQQRSIIESPKYSTKVHCQLKDKIGNENKDKSIFRKTIEIKTIK